MADRKLNEVPVVNDISHLLGVRSMVKLFA